MNKPHRFLSLNSLHFSSKELILAYKITLFAYGAGTLNSNRCDVRPVFSVYCTREINLKFIRNMFSNMYSTTIVTPQIASYKVDKVSTQNLYRILIVIW